MAILLCTTGISNKTTAKARAKFDESERVVAYRDFVSNNCHILTANPTLLWQQALNQPSHSLISCDVTSLMEREAASGGGIMKSISLVEWMNKPQTADPCAYTLSGLTEVATRNEIYLCEVS